MIKLESDSFAESAKRLKALSIIMWAVYTVFFTFYFGIFLIAQITQSYFPEVYIR